MRRVALVSYFCPPQLNAESILVWKTIRALSASHALTVVTSDVRAARVDTSMTIPENVRVVRFHQARYPTRVLAGIARRATTLFCAEQDPWARASLSRLEGAAFDVVYSRSQPGASHILAARMRRAFDLPWIAQFSDPWASNPFVSGATPMRTRHDNACESLTVHQADRLIFPCVDVLDLYAAKYERVDVRAKSVVLPHHTSAALYDAEPSDFSAEEGRLNLACFGDFYGLRSPEPLVRAIGVLCDRRPDLRNALAVHLFGRIEPRYQPLLAASPIPIRTGQLSYLKSLSAMKNADILLVVDSAYASGTAIFLPSKLIDYLGAQRPILGIAEDAGTLPSILREFGYPVIAPNDADALSRQLEAWIEKPPGVSPRSIERFQTSVVVGRLSALLEEVAAERKRSRRSAAADPAALL